MNGCSKYKRSLPEDVVFRFCFLKDEKVKKDVVYMALEEGFEMQL